MSSPVKTPLLSKLYADFDEHIKINDPYPVERERLAIPAQVPLLNKNAFKMSSENNERFGRMAMAWNKLKGEPMKKVRRKKAVYKPKRKAKRKTKWVPRKQYLAAQRKKKFGAKNRK